MATPNRSALITRTIKVLRKHFKPVTPPKDRSLFEHLLFACLVEDSPPETAEQVLATLKQDYFGWNEVRVSTIRELTEVCKPLVNPADAAGRLKQTLQSVFESVYEFDIETFKKQNIGQAVKMLQKYRGTTPFVVAYTTQMALGGHSIPINRGALISLHTVGVISDDEFKKRVVPGLERTVSKNKGVEVGSLLHQLGVEVWRNPTGQNARKLLLEIDPKCKDRLPKRQTYKPEPVEPPKPAPPVAPSKATAKDVAAAKAAAASKTPPAKPAKMQKGVPPTKRPAEKKAAKQSKRPTKKGTKKPTTRKLAKRKPR
jgi:endonuclease-3